MRRALWLVPPAAALAAALVSLPPSWIESQYSRGAYLALERRLTTASNAVPFATTDALLAIAAVLVILAIRSWIRRARGSSVGVALIRAVVGVTTTASVIYLVFALTWGLNYGREPLRARLDYDPARVTPVAVAAFAASQAVGSPLP